MNAAKGDLFTSGAEEFEQVKPEEMSSKGRVLDLVLPVAVLIISAVGAMIYTGFLGGATDIITAFAGCDAETTKCINEHHKNINGKNRNTIKDRKALIYFDRSLGIVLKFLI